MSLQLTGSWEHALLAVTAQEAAAAGDSGYLGRTALQKILYFLYIAGIPMSYSFDIYHYGPYCAGISGDVEWLLADEVLKDTSPAPEKYSNYRPGPGADQLIGAHAATLEPYRATITRVVRTLLPLQPEHLELLATLNYLFRWLKAGGGQGPWKDRVIARFLEVKKGKFPLQEVTAAYDSLVRAELVEP